MENQEVMVLPTYVVNILENNLFSIETQLQENFGKLNYIWQRFYGPYKKYCPNCKSYNIPYEAIEGSEYCVKCGTQLDYLTRPVGLGFCYKKDNKYYFGFSFCHDRDIYDDVNALLKACNKEDIVSLHALNDLRHCQAIEMTTNDKKVINYSYLLPQKLYGNEGYEVMINYKNKNTKKVQKRIKTAFKIGTNIFHLILNNAKDLDYIKNIVLFKNNNTFNIFDKPKTIGDWYDYIKSLPKGKKTHVMEFIERCSKYFKVEKFN